MGATKQDRSGIFDTALRQPRVRKTTTLAQGFELSTKGITFISERFLPEWTEVGVEMRLPGEGSAAPQQIDCRGVVVQCHRRSRGKGFEVALLFLDLPKHAHAQLTNQPAATSPFSVSIAR